MIRDYERETVQRVAFIQDVLRESGAGGIVFGSSGGKDSALVGILCRMAAENVLGVILPCESSMNFGQDRDDAYLLGKHYEIEHIEIDLTNAKTAFVDCLNYDLPDFVNINIAPRLRMAALYAIAAKRNFLVAGTGNRSEGYMGYFTKWGDGASDFNPISDLTVTEIFEFLEHLKAPATFTQKAPSAGLFEGQTDETDMGVSYAELDKFLLKGEMVPNMDKILSANRKSAHKRQPIPRFRP